MVKKLKRLSPDQSARVPTKIDVEIGKRVRESRKSAGMTQGDLAEALGTTFQQVQKYEHAQNRLAASRLVQIGDVLKVSAAWLLLGK